MMNRINTTSTLPFIAFSLFACVSACGDITLSYEVEVDKTVYNIGEDVAWSVFVSLTPNTVDPNNGGLAGLTFDLVESEGAALEPMDASDFDNIWTLSQAATSPGTIDPGDTSRLQDIEVACIAIAPFSCMPLGADGARLPVASGSYTITQPGLHVLSTETPNPDDNAHYNAGQTMAVKFLADSINQGSVTLSAIPEPNAFVLSSIISGCLGAYCLARRIWRTGGK